MGKDQRTTLQEVVVVLREQGKISPAAAGMQGCKNVFRTSGVKICGTSSFDNSRVSSGIYSAHHRRRSKELYRCRRLIRQWLIEQQYSVCYGIGRSHRPIYHLWQSGGVENILNSASGAILGFFWTSRARLPPLDSGSLPPLRDTIP